MKDEHFVGIEREVIVHLNMNVHSDWKRLSQERNQITTHEIENKEATSEGGEGSVTGTTDSATASVSA